MLTPKNISYCRLLTQGWKLGQLRRQGRKEKELAQIRQGLRVGWVQKRAECFHLWLRRRFGLDGEKSEEGTPAR